MTTRHPYLNGWKQGFSGAIVLTALWIPALPFPGWAETPPQPRSSSLAFFEVPRTDSIAVFEFKSRRVIKKIPLGGEVPSGEEGTGKTDDIQPGRYLYWARHGADDISVVDTLSLEVVRRIPLSVKGPGNVTVARDRHALFIPHYQEKALTIFDLRTEKQRVVRLDGYPGDIAATPQGILLITSRDSNQVLALDEATGRIAAIDVGRNPVGIAATPDGSQAYVSHDTEAVVAVIDLRDKPYRVIKRIRLAVAGGSAVASAPDGKHMLVAHCCANSSVTVLSVRSMTVQCEISLGPEGLDPVRIVFSPGGDEAFIINSGSMNISSFRLPCGSPVTENLFD